MIPINKIRSYRREFMASSAFRKMLTFLVFVVIAALFWFIMALNDSAQDDFEVRVAITNVPDSVTFINLPPQKIHVMVRDQGVNLWRNGILVRPAVEINFRDFSNDGRFIVRRSELYAALKNVLGSSASLLSSSVDSLSLRYTTLPGRRVPVAVSADLSPALGKIITGSPEVIPASVTVYSTGNVLDTLTKVYTEHFVSHNLEETVELPIRLKSMPGVRVEPSAVTVKVNVEPLVRKQATVNVRVQYLPEGMDLLLFPSNVQVEYYVPMGKFDAGTLDKVDVAVDYRDLERKPRRLPLYIVGQARGLLNIRLLTDSVEYTLVKN